MLGDSSRWSVTTLVLLPFQEVSGLKARVVSCVQRRAGLPLDGLVTQPLMPFSMLSKKTWLAVLPAGHWSGEGSVVKERVAL